MQVASAAASNVDDSFQRNPLGYFDRQLETADATFWISPSTLCVADADAAKAVLANADGHFREHSDFFHTRRGPFGPRTLQRALAAGARRLLTTHVTQHAGDLPSTIESVLGSESLWPDAGNRLMDRHFASVLLTPERRPALGGRLRSILEHAVYAGARDRRSRLARLVFRHLTFRALTREIEHRVAESNSHHEAPRDLFDVLAEGAELGARPADLGELYLPFYFAVTSSVGFTLAWALRLLGLHGEDRHGADPDIESGWIVREALRLWPIAWQMDRYPAEPHVIAGVEVGPETTVLLSPYVSQRHPAHWSAPTQFRPERWADAGDHSAFFPFGWGPHTCAAAALSLEVATAALDVIRQRYRFEIHTRSSVPFTGPSLAPPRFRLTTRRRTHPIDARRR